MVSGILPLVLDRNCHPLGGWNSAAPPFYDDGKKRDVPYAQPTRTVLCREAFLSAATHSLKGGGKDTRGGVAGVKRPACYQRSGRPGPDARRNHLKGYPHDGSPGRGAQGVGDERILEAHASAS